MSKKLVQINVTCNGSTGRIMQQLQETAIANGFEAVSFYGRGEPGKTGKYIRIGNDFDVKTHGVVTRIFDKHGHASVNATKKMIEQIEKINPDVIQLHNLHGYYLNLKILFNYLKKSKAKKIWTLHDCWAFTGHCSYFTMAKCDKWKEGCYDCPQKKEYPKSIFIDNSKEEYEFKKNLFNGIEDLTIVTPSEWLANLVKQSFLSRYPIKVINNGIDLNIFRPVDGSEMREKLKISKEKKIVLGVASIWEKRKGFKYFLDLSQILENNEIIVLVGLNKRQIKNLPQNIIGIERTENINELVELYSMSDVFFNPSYEETFSLVTIEAVACGLPVLVFDSSAVTEIVNRESGKILNNYDINNVKKSINDIIYSGKYKDKHIINMQSKNYEIKLKCDEYIKLYS